MSDLLAKLFDLTGKTAIITGGASDIARQISKTLASVGAHVISLDMIDNNINSLSQEIEPLPGSLEFHLIDLTDVSALTKFIKQITSSHAIDILINSARFRAKTCLTEFQPDIWDKHFEVNSKIAWMMTQLITKSMIEKHIQGSIINLASINGDNVPVVGWAAYCASKAAIIQISKQLVAELSPYGIRINSISPGLFNTSATRDNIEANKEVISKRIPIGFVGEPSDLDGLILFLASNNASRYVTGANYIIDGGVSVARGF